MHCVNVCFTENCEAELCAIVPSQIGIWDGEKNPGLSSLLLSNLPNRKVQSFTQSVLETGEYRLH